MLLKSWHLRNLQSKVMQKKIKFPNKKAAFKNYEGVTLASRGAEKSFFLLFFTKRTVFGGLGFFLLRSLVMCPCTGLSKRCSINVFSLKKLIPSCAALGKASLIKAQLVF